MAEIINIKDIKRGERAMRILSVDMDKVIDEMERALRNAELDILRDIAHQHGYSLIKITELKGGKDDES